MRLKLKRFRPQRVESCRTMLMVGRRGSGKSTMEETMMCWQRDKLDYVVVFSGTEDENGFWGKHLPPNFIYNNLYEEVLDKWVKEHRMAFKRAKRAGKRLPSIGIIIDDCMHDADVIRKAKVVRWIMLNGRHVNIFLLISAQWMLDCPTWFRENLDYVAAFRNHIVANRERYYMNFYGVFPSFESFDRVFQSETEEKGRALVIDNIVDSNEVLDTISWWKGTLDLVYDVGHQDQWLYYFKDLLNMNKELLKAIQEDPEKHSSLEEVTRLSKKLEYHINSASSMVQGCATPEQWHQVRDSGEWAKRRQRVSELEDQVFGPERDYTQPYMSRVRNMQEALRQRDAEYNERLAILEDGDEEAMGEDLHRYFGKRGSRNKPTLHVEHDRYDPDEEREMQFYSRHQPDTRREPGGDRHNRERHESHREKERQREREKQKENEREREREQQARRRPHGQGQGHRHRHRHRAQI